MMPCATVACLKALFCQQGGCSQAWTMSSWMCCLAACELQPATPPTPHKACRAAQAAAAVKQPGQGPNADLIMKAFAAVARKDGFASQLEGLELLPQVLQGSGLQSRAAGSV